MTSSIVIVGGGSAGWLAAATMIKYFPEKKITLVESKNIPTIGVGESTTALVKHFINSHLGVSDTEFMKGVDAIYKSSVKFNDFYYIGDGGFHYPFGQPYLADLDALGTESWDLVKHFNKQLDRNNYAESLYPAYSLFTANKIDENLNGEFDSYNFQIANGYHLDANKLGIWLRDFYCAPRGVNHIIGDVSDVTTTQDGVESIILVDGSVITGDLFIDCTGFKSLLLGKLNPEFVDVSGNLPNNKAWATPIKYKDVYREMTPYTTCTALANGWAWYTPIGSRIGNGYAYSDKYVDSAGALLEFKEYLKTSIPVKLSSEEIDALPFFEIKMRAGYYKEGMIKNVVAIGLSGGFLEPLEGTGIHIIIEALLQISKMLERKGINQFVIDAYNSYMVDVFEMWKETLSLFYAQSVRDDSEYWREIKNKKYNFKDWWGRIARDHGNNRFNDAYTAIAHGCDFAMDIDNPTLDRWNMYAGNTQYYPALANELKKIFENRVANWKYHAANATHIYDYLRDKGIINESS